MKTTQLILLLLILYFSYEVLLYKYFIYKQNSFENYIFGSKIYLYVLNKIIYTFFQFNIL
jgi:hypothetical protein